MFTGLTLLLVYVYPTPGFGFSSVYVVVCFKFNDLQKEVVVCFMLILVELFTTKL